MRRFGSRAIPAGLLALTVAALIAMVVLSLGFEPLYDTVLYGVMALALGVAGTLVASRHPDNPVGWLFCAMAVFSALSELAEGYGKHQAFSGAEPAQWFASWSWAVAAGGWVLVFVLFPSGRLASPRWRLVVWTAITGVALTVVGSGLGHSADAAFTRGENPYAVDGVGIDAITAVGQILFVIALLAAVASLIVRFRRSAGVERQQFKLVAYPVSALAAIGPLAAVAYFDNVLVQVAIALVVTAIPAAVCVAILRYRLYDIDVVINRTLVYGALTATLAGAYLGIVLLFQLVLSPLTEQSDLAIAGSTLAVAALFGPARVRIQALVDRRFYRRRYDAARTLERFGVHLRDEVDLDALGSELRGVVADTMQPAHVSLWLRAPGGDR